MNKAVSLISLFSLAFTLGADIYLDSDGNESPNGKPFMKSWFSEIGNYRPSGNSESNLDEFRVNAKDIIDWQVMKEMRTDLYGPQRSHANNANSYINYIQHEGERVQDFVPILAKLAPTPWYKSYKSYDVEFKGTDIKDVLAGVGEKGRKALKDSAESQEELDMICAGLKEKEVIPSLIKRLKTSADPAILNALRNFGVDAKDALPALKEIFNSEKRPIFRFKIATAILTLEPGNKDVASFIDDLKKDPKALNELKDNVDFLECLSLIPTLENFNLMLDFYQGQASTPYIKQKYGDFTKAILEKLGEKDFEMVLNKLKEKTNPTLFSWAFPFFWKYPDISLPIMMTYVDRGDSSVKYSCIDAAKKIPPEKLKPFLLKALSLLKSENTVVKETMLGFISAMGPGAASIIPEFKSLSSDDKAYQAAYDAAMNAACPEKPDDAVAYMLKNNLVNEGNKHTFIIMLEKCDNVPAGAAPCLAKIFAGKDGFKEDYGIFIDGDGRLTLNMRIYNLLTKNPDNVKALMPYLPDMASDYQFGYAYASLYIRHSQDADSALKQILDKNICPDKLGRMFLEYARKTGDYAKAYSSAKEYQSKLGMKPGNDTSDNCITSMLYLLADTSNLPDETRKNIVLESLKCHSTFQGKISGQNTPILIELIDGKDISPKAKEKIEYLLLGLGDYTKSPLDFTNCPRDIHLRYIRKLPDFLKKIDTSNPQDAPRNEKIFAMFKHAFAPSVKKELLETIFSCMVDGNGNINPKAAETIQSFGTSILPELAENLNGDDPFISMLACSTISGMGVRGRPAAKELEKLASMNPDWTLRICAIYALGEIGPADNYQTVLPMLKKALDDEKEKVRMAAAKALILLGGIPEGDPALEKICNSGLFKEDQTSIECKKNIMGGL